MLSITAKIFKRFNKSFFGLFVPIILTALVALAGLANVDTVNNIAAEPTAVTLSSSIINVQNAATINNEWVGSIGGAALSSSPVVADGNVYIGSKNGSVYVFDASGVQNCAYGTPVTCTPKFTVTPITGTPVLTTPVVYNNILYVTSGDQLFAYDATGVTNCSGTPAVCTPLWVTKSNSGSNVSTPVITNGTVYFHDSLGLYAYDAAGATNCSGTPTICLPLWQAPTGGMSVAAPAIYGNTVFTISQGVLLAYNATAGANCTGTPITCTPIWSSNVVLSGQFGVVVSGSTVYAIGANIFGFDATGVTNCSGAPAVCSPIWTGEVSTNGGQFYSSVSVANNVLYVEGPGELLAFDVMGVTDCVGTTPVCLPIWSGQTGLDSGIYNANSIPTVSSGVVYVGNSDQKLYLFDASGSVNCTTGTNGETSCTPLAIRTTGGSIESTPTVYNGNVFVGSDDGNLYAYGHAAQYANVTGGPITNMTTTPQSLDPGFSSDATNYILVCQPGINPFSLTLSSSTSQLTLNGTSGSSLSLSFNLYPNQALVVNDTLSNGSAVQDWIRCLPPDFPVPTVSKPGVTPPGYYMYGAFNTANFSSDVGNYAVIADQNGIPVWYQKVNSPLSPLNFQLLRNDTLSWSGINLFNFSNIGYQNLQLDSNSHTNMFAPDGITGGHELIQRPDGNYYILGNVLTYGNLSSLGLGTDAPFINYLIEEFSPSGQLLWEWNLADHIGPNQSETKFLSTINDNGITANVIYHANSLDVSSDGSMLLLSIRDTSAVYEISKATGQVLWKLGGNGVSSSPQIKIVGDSLGGTSGQHDARFEPNNDISVFDDQSFTSNAGRAIEYHLDFSTMTATPVFQYVNPTGLNTFAMGSFRRYDNGNDNVIDWGMTPQSGYTEVNASGSVLMHVTFPTGYSSYRTIKVPLSAISLNLMRDNAGLPPSALVSSQSSVTTSNVSGNYFNSVSPTRILDTRTGLGQGGTISPLGPGQILSLNLKSVSSIPSDATSVILNVTATDTSQWSYMTVYGGGAPLPNTSNLNWYHAGQTVANTVVAPIDSTGKINFYNAFGSVDVVADVEGYVGPAPPGSGLYNPISETRICDTRTNSGLPCAGQTLQQNSTLTIQATGVAGIPSSGVSAVLVNVTATNTTADGGFLTIYPAGGSAPNTSSLNWSQGETVANSVFATVNPGGQISIHNSIGSADVIVDVVGYFTDSSNPLATGDEINTVLPTVRLADTRSTSIFPATATPIAPGGTLTVPVSNFDNVAGTSMSGVIVNITATNTTGTGFITVYPSGTATPNTSTLNYFGVGETVCNLAYVQLGSSSSITIKNTGNSYVDVVVDLQGWY